MKLSCYLLIKKTQTSKQIKKYLTYITDIYIGGASMKATIKNQISEVQNLLSSQKGWIVNRGARVHKFWPAYFLSAASKYDLWFYSGEARTEKKKLEGEGEIPNAHHTWLFQHHFPPYVVNHITIECGAHKDIGAHLEFPKVECW